MPTGLNDEEMLRIDSVVSNRQTLKRGEPLFQNGTPFESLYAVRTGTFKTCLVNEQGREQVFGFQIAGEILGLDGIVDEIHSCNAVALERAEVCVLPMAFMEELSGEIPSLARHMHKVMSREIVRERGVMQLLGSMRAEERVAAFLLNLLQRLSTRGFSSTELVLRMTREEIGSYLGLKLETVSRAFSKLVELNTIEVANRHVHIKDMEALRRLASSCS